MSATTRPARVTVSRAVLAAKPAVAPAPAPGRLLQRRTPLTVVSPAGVLPARTPFVGLVVVLIVAGLMALLTLNTVLQQASFTVTRLERHAAELADREQALAQEVAQQEAPQRLAERAVQLGMVPSETPAFIRAADGTVLGVPAPARAPARAPIEVPVAPPPPTDVPGTIPGTVPGAAPELLVPEPPTPGPSEVAPPGPNVVGLPAPLPPGAPADEQPPAVGQGPVEATTP